MVPLVFKTSLRAVWSVEGSTPSLLRQRPFRALAEAREEAFTSRLAMLNVNVVDSGSPLRHSLLTALEFAVSPVPVSNMSPRFSSKSMALLSVEGLKCM